MCKITYSFGETSVCYEAETVEDLIRLVESQCEGDGWIEWNGGKLPVNDGERVKVKVRGGNESTTNRPEYWRWSHNGDSGDIVAYKVEKS